MPIENSSNFLVSNQNRNNMPEISWETCQSSNDYEETIINFAIDDNLKQHVNFKTTASSFLDLVVTSNDALINSVRTESLDKFSDRLPVEIQLSLNEKTRKTGRVEYYSYCKCHFDEMVAEMKSNPFQPYNSNIDVYTNLWYKWLFELIDRFTPKRTRKRQSYPPWISNETCHRLNQLETESRTLKKGNSTSGKLSD